MVDREDGTGAGFTGVLPAAQSKTDDQIDCVVNCAKNGGKNCQIECSVTNKDQCANGRNKCSENAVCTDLEDEIVDGNFTRKLSTTINLY